MSKKIYRTRRKHRSNKRSIKRTNRKIHKRTYKKAKRNNERISRKIIYGKKQHGGTLQYYSDLAGSKLKQAEKMISSKLKEIEEKVEEKAEDATKSLESFKEKYEIWDEVELTWDNNNSYDINFDFNTGILRGKAYLRYGGGRWKFKLFPNRFKLEENDSVLYINIPPGGVDLAKNDEENDISLTRKITIYFTGQRANDNKQNLMDSLHMFRSGLVNYSQPTLRGRNIRPRSSSLSSSSSSLQLPLVGDDSRYSLTPPGGLIFRANSPHPSNTTPGTPGTPPIRIPAPQSVELVGFPIVKFVNSGNHCYRNAVYSVFLNNAFIRREIMRLNMATSGTKFNRDAYNNFITCLKNIALGETKNNGFHPGGLNMGGQPLQINTAMYNYITSYVQLTKSNEWVRFLDSDGGLSNEDQQDSGEFLGYFSRAFSLLGIKVCEYEQITATMMLGQSEQKFWNETNAAWEALSPSTYRVELFDDTHKPHELGIDPKTGKRKSIFTFYSEIFIRNQITYGIDTTVIASPLVTIPNFVCLNDNRYEHTTIDGNVIHNKNMVNYKIRKVIHVPIYFINDNNELGFRVRDYNCCGVIFHLGNTPNIGHYVSCVKIIDDWYFFNDGHDPQILKKNKVKKLFADKFQPPVDYVSPVDRFTIVTAIYELDRSSD